MQPLPQLCPPASISVQPSHLHPLSLCLEACAPSAHACKIELPKALLSLGCSSTWKPKIASHCLGDAARILPPVSRRSAIWCSHCHSLPASSEVAWASLPSLLPLLEAGILGPGVFPHPNFVLQILSKHLVLVLPSALHSCHECIDFIGVCLLSGLFNTLEPSEGKHTV